MLADPRDDAQNPAHLTPAAAPGGADDLKLSADPAVRRQMREEIARFLMTYRFGIDEMMTKVNILKDEFRFIHDYSPIEHVGSRLKSPASILEKAARKNCPLTLDAIREQITDIAGIRITCSFVADTYRIRDMLLAQADVDVVAVKDYIAEPKENGYQSLHLLVELPVFMSDRVERVTVEIQIRTIAMDFWASLEHKIYYKYDRQVPPRLLAELKDAAEVAARLDRTMEHLHNEVNELRDEREPTAPREGSVETVLTEGLIDAFLGRTTSVPPRNRTA